MNVSPTEYNILAAMRSFLIAVLPSDVVVVAAQVNRVSEPTAKRFVVMSPPRYERLRTNVDSYADAKFTGSIAGALMTITHVYPGFPGQIGVGSTIFGAGVAANTTVTAVGTGTGGLGTYTVDPPQTVGSVTLSAGSENIEQGAKATVQLDFHAADGTSGDLAQVVSTLMRDDFAFQQFANQDPNYGVAPLLADDPRQMPFVNDQQQTEFRWVLDAQLQCNQIVTVPQQFADAATVNVVNVEEAYGA